MRGCTSLKRIIVNIYCNNSYENTLKYGLFTDIHLLYEHESKQNYTPISVLLFRINR